MNPLRSFVCVVVVLCLATTPSVAVPADTLTILHLNDTHSNLAPRAPRTVDLQGTVGGIARAATVIGMTRLEEKNVLLLHAGDIFIGDPMFNAYFGVPEMEILQSLGLDALTLGNHEFDLTPFTLWTAIDTATSHGVSFPILSANAICADPAVAPLAKHVVPHTIKTFGNLKVGIFGMTTPETNMISLPAPVVFDTSLSAIAQKVVLENLALRQDGCSVVVLLSHMGMAADQFIAASLPNIDVIVGGHDHEALSAPVAIPNPSGDTTYIVQAGAFYGNVGRLRLIADAQSVRLLDYALIPLDSSVPEEPTVAGIVQMLTAGIEEKFGPLFSEKIWTAPARIEELATNLLQVRNASTPLGRHVARAFKLYQNTDLGFTVGGATAQPIEAGPVVRADVLRALGYGYNERDELGFRLASFTISGADLMAGIEWGLSNIELNDEYFPIGYPLDFWYDASRPAFQRLDSVKINRVPIDPAADYRVTSNELVLAILKDFLAPQLGITIKNDRVSSDSTEFKALVWYLTSGTVNSAPSTSDIPSEFTLDANYPNPFNPSTVVGYSLPASSRTRLAVFNILGQEVAVLEEGIRPAGFHSTHWRATVASGVYFYRLEAIREDTGQRFSQTRKMQLLK